MSESTSSQPITRRTMLQSAAAAVLAGSTTGLAVETKGPAVTKGRIKQSLVEWCYTKTGDQWSIDKLCEVANALGVTSVEICPPSDYPTLKKYGLKCAIGSIDMSPDAPFKKGFNNPVHWPRVIKATTDAIDAAADFGVPNVIAFTGYAATDPDDPKSEKLTSEQGAKNCIEGFKKVVGHAEKKNVTIALEMLNTRDSSHPMKGHPGYQGDHVDYCIDIIKQVGSPHLKLLFDIYHVQIMDGDVIRHLRQNIDYISHIHTAGNPGRGELDNKQEINYPPIMEALLELGYTGYVGQEFIPTRDAYQGLHEAVTLCDV
jgi:hydroxypyruvate isomerase